MSEQLRHTTRSVAAPMAFTGFNDPTQPERSEPRLHLVQEASLTRAPAVALFPPALRLMTRPCAWSPTLAPKARILRYRFGGPVVPGSG